MIRYLSHKEIDKSLWDACILASGENVIYGLSWYLDIVSPQWEALVMDNYDAVFPLTSRKKLSFNYLYQPYFTQQLGLFNKSDKSDLLKLFLANIPSKFKLIEIQLSYKTCISDADDHKGFSVNERITYHLNLSASAEELLKNYSENQKRNIKKFEKSEGGILENIATKNVIELFKKNRGKKVSNLKKTDYEVLEHLYDTAKNKELLQCYGILNNNTLECGAVFLQSAHSYIFHFSATSDHARNSGALSAVIHHFIKKHSGENKFLDFEGSMDSQLARFYKGFGSKEIVYLQILQNKLPPPFRWLK